MIWRALWQECLSERGAGLLSLRDEMAALLREFCRELGMSPQEFISLPVETRIDLLKGERKDDGLWYGWRIKMTRVMIDTTNKGFSVALQHITALPAGNIVALYDTGSPDIAATPADIAAVPGRLAKVFIDQGFTGSPNLKANVRDCENGAWTIPSAVQKGGWNVARPTLYIGAPDTLHDAEVNGWKGDVWIVAPSSVPPTAPPAAPPGMNIVAVQWGFGNPAFDESVVFDSTWPDVAPPPHAIQQDRWRYCHKCQGLFYGPNQGQSHCPAGGQHDGAQSGNYVLTDIVG